jgi:hypothetical protein
MRLKIPVAQNMYVDAADEKCGKYKHLLALSAVIR